MEVEEEDAPLEEWSVKELKEECKTLGVSDKGKKAELIERIKEAKASVEEPAEEAVVEEAVVEEAVVEEAEAEEPAAEEPLTEEATAEEPAIEEAAAEEAAEEPEAEAMEVEEEDAPLEEWSVKELKEECKALGVSDKGKKAELIVRIKEAKASVEESVEEAVVEEAAV